MFKRRSKGKENFRKGYFLPFLPPSVYLNSVKRSVSLAPDCFFIQCPAVVQQHLWCHSKRIRFWHHPKYPEKLVIGKQEGRGTSFPKDVDKTWNPRLEGSRTFLKSVVNQRLSHTRRHNFYPQDLISELGSSVPVQLLRVFYEKSSLLAGVPIPPSPPPPSLSPSFFPATPSCCS